MTASHERESAAQGHGHCFTSWSGSDWEQLSVSGTDFFWGHCLQVPVDLRFHLCQKIQVHFELGGNLFHGPSWKRVHLPHTTRLQEIPVFLREAFLEERGVSRTRCHGSLTLKVLPSADSIFLTNGTPSFLPTAILWLGGWIVLRERKSL